MSEIQFKVLSGILNDPKVAMDFCFQYGDKYFTDPRAQIIASNIVRYVKSYRAKPTTDTIEKFVKDDSARDLILNFWERHDSYNYDEYNFDVEQLKKEFAYNKFEELRFSLNQEESEGLDPIKAINSVQNEINEIKSINSASEYNSYTLKDFNEQFKENYKAKYENPELGVGILTGFSYLDYIKNGLVDSDLVIICGETGSGKSVMLNNMALNIWKQKNTIDTPVDNFEKGYNVSYFSLEMPFENCHQRTMAALSDVEIYHLRDAKLTRAEAAGVSKAVKFIENYPHEFDIIDVPRNFTVEQLELKFQQIKARYEPDVIFIDYMGLMDNTSDEDDWLKLGTLAGKIHEFARTYKVPVVTAVQLNRMDPAKKKDGKAIGLHRIGRSALIATHATLIIQLDSGGEYKDDIDYFRYHIIKNRNGEMGSHSIEKNFANSLIRDVPYDESEDMDYGEDSDLSKILDKCKDDISDILNNW